MPQVMSKTPNISAVGPIIEACVLVLMATGTVFVYSAGADVKSDYDLQRFFDFTIFKQLFFFPFAVAVMYAVKNMDYRRFSFRTNPVAKSITPYLLILAIFLLVLVLIPGIGTEKNGARRWLSVSIGFVSFSFQPSELAKWALVFFLAAFVDRFAETIKLYWKRFVPLCIIAGLVIALIVTQDFGTAAFIAMLTFLMLLIGGACWWHFLTPLPVLLPVFYFAIASSPHRIDRLKAFFRPDIANNALYQARQSLIAIGSGRLWGKGLGRGISKYGHLPEDTTDFIFSIIAEELGFIGAAFVVVIFAVVVVFGIILVLRCKDPFGSILAGGIVLTLAIQAAINIGVATVVLPTKGIPLPFISAGGTSMLLCAAAAGVLLNIAKRTAAGELEQ